MRVSKVGQIKLSNAPSILTFVRANVLYAALLLAAPSPAGNGCDHVWSLGRLARDAKRLDGQAVCVRALLRPLPIQDRNSRALYVYEAVPLDRRERPINAYRVGLLDWDSELGIDESPRRLESYDLIESAARQCSGPAKTELSFDTEFRAVVEYRHSLTERAYAALPPSLSQDVPKRSRYETELVILEFIKVTAVCGKYRGRFGLSKTLRFGMGWAGEDHAAGAAGWERTATRRPA